MNRFLRTATVLPILSLALALSACCGDTTATVQVHVVDGENGAEIAMPQVLVDGDQATCGDNHFFQSAPVPTDDGGTVVGPPTSDFGVGPPPSTHFCATWIANVDPGTKIVKVTASGYFGTETQIDTGSEGGAMSCPSPRDVEVTVAIYRKPG
jgi:hypothetical protein